LKMKVKIANVLMC